MNAQIQEPCLKVQEPFDYSLFWILVSIPKQEQKRNQTKKKKSFFYFPDDVQGIPNKMWLLIIYVLPLIQTMTPSPWVTQVKDLKQFAKLLDLLVEVTSPPAVLIGFYYPELFNHSPVLSSGIQLNQDLQV